MIQNGWYNTTFACFNPQASKIVGVFHMGLSWDIWAQVELGLACKRESDRNRGKDATVLSEFTRQKRVYDGSNGRCDFLASYTMTQGSLRLHYFMDLKCLQKNKLPDFLNAVSLDIDKVKATTPLKEWADSVAYVGGHVMAISVSPVSDNRVERKMLQLAESKGITWEGSEGRGLPLGEEGTDRVILWTWSWTFIKTEKAQQAMASYVDWWKR
ncbi:hypothetical protein V2G26_011383 [Clonostachys chloroleuca]